MQAENSRSASGRWTTRDILTFVVFNLVIVFLTMAAKMIEDMLLAPQNTFFVGSWLFPLISTPFYVVMADRIGKRGVLAASILVFGVLYTFMGGLYCAPVAVVGAVVGELVMWGKGSYHDIKRIVGGYIVYWVTASCPTCSSARRTWSSSERTTTPPTSRRWLPSTRSFPGSFS